MCQLSDKCTIDQRDGATHCSSPKTQFSSDDKKKICCSVAFIFPMKHSSHMIVMKWRTGIRLYQSIKVTVAEKEYQYLYTLVVYRCPVVKDCPEK
jgi:hypothetical protein